MNKFIDTTTLPYEGLVQQEIITYRIINGVMHKTTVTRKYMSGDDYQDSTTTEVLYAAN